MEYSLQDAEFALQQAPHPVFRRLSDICLEVQRTEMCRVGALHLLNIIWAKPYKSFAALRLC